MIEVLKHDEASKSALLFPKFPQIFFRLLKQINQTIKSNKDMIDQIYIHITASTLYTLFIEAK